ncbi:hypothetical protein A3Q56_04898 [Intoshia linei]|uniref:LIM zinc-binding domain-containing protein n=1 Tax=Intoshia linei TaxID=1819745 RepID=A0A177AZB4_9BILA|nr:hypothetical protein A3Q56_04898 [Intoshia linei]
MKCLKIHRSRPKIGLVCNLCEQDCGPRCLLVNKSYLHKNCFVCSVCKVQLKKRKYFKVDDTYYCKIHVKQTNSIEISIDEPSYIDKIMNNNTKTLNGMSPESEEIEEDDKANELKWNNNPKREIKLKKYSIETFNDVCLKNASRDLNTIIRRGQLVSESKVPNAKVVRMSQLINMQGIGVESQMNRNNIICGSKKPSGDATKKKNYPIEQLDWPAPVHFVSTFPDIYRFEKRVDEESTDESEIESKPSSESNTNFQTTTPSIVMALASDSVFPPSEIKVCKRKSRSKIRSVRDMNSVKKNFGPKSVGHDILNGLIKEKLQYDIDKKEFAPRYYSRKPEGFTIRRVKRLRYFSSQYASPSRMLIKSRSQSEQPIRQNSSDKDAYAKFCNRHRFEPTYGLLYSKKHFKSVGISNDEKIDGHEPEIHLMNLVDWKLLKTDVKKQRTQSHRIRFFAHFQNLITTLEYLSDYINFLNNKQCILFYVNAREIANPLKEVKFENLKENSTILKICNVFVVYYDNKTMIWEYLKNEMKMYESYANNESTKKYTNTIYVKIINNKGFDSILLYIASDNKISETKKVRVIKTAPIPLNKKWSLFKRIMINGNTIFSLDIKNISRRLNFRVYNLIEIDDKINIFIKNITKLKMIVFDNEFMIVTLQNHTKLFVTREMKIINTNQNNNLAKFHDKGVEIGKIYSLRNQILIQFKNIRGFLKSWKCFFTLCNDQFELIMSNTSYNQFKTLKDGLNWYKPITEMTYTMPTLKLDTFNKYTIIYAVSETTLWLSFDGMRSFHFAKDKICISKIIQYNDNLLPNTKIKVKNIPNCISQSLVYKIETISGLKIFTNITESNVCLIENTHLKIERSEKVQCASNDYVCTLKYARDASNLCVGSDSLNKTKQKVCFNGKMQSIDLAGYKSIFNSSYNKKNCFPNYFNVPSNLTCDDIQRILIERREKKLDKGSCSF